jgi:hypothetical protein
MAGLGTAAISANAIAKRSKLRDKVLAVTSFFDFASKHPWEVTPEDVSGWRERMEGRGLKPATVYARSTGAKGGSSRLGKSLMRQRTRR